MSRDINAGLKLSLTSSAFIHWCMNPRSRRVRIQTSFLLRYNTFTLGLWHRICEAKRDHQLNICNDFILIGPSSDQQERNVRWLVDLAVRDSAWFWWLKAWSWDLEWDSRLDSWGWIEVSGCHDYTQRRNTSQAFRISFGLKVARGGTWRCQGLPDWWCGIFLLKRSKDAWSLLSFHLDVVVEHDGWSEFALGGERWKPKVY